MITHSLEETNRLREQLGLPPLVIPRDEKAEQEEKKREVLEQLDQKIGANQKAAEAAGEAGLVMQAYSLLQECERLQLEKVGTKD